MMRYLAISIIVIATIVLAGCSVNSKNGDVNDAPGPGLEIPAVTRPSVPDLLVDSLGGALSYVERAEDGQTYYPTAHLAPIDYKSKLFVVPNKDRIKQMATTGKHILPGLSPDTQKRLQNLPRLIEQAQTYVDSASRVLKRVEAAQRSEEELTQNQIELIQKDIAAQGQLGLDIVDLIIEVAEARAGVEYRGDQEAMDQAVARLTKRLMEDADGRPVILNVQEFGAFLSEEIDFAMARAREDAETAEKRGTARFRMWAQLRGQQRWVSVRPYFEAGSFEGQKAPRVALTMNAQEQERLRTGFEIATDAAKLIRDSRDGESGLRRELASLWKTLRSELQLLSDLPTGDILKDVNDLLVEAIDLAIDANVASTEETLALKGLREFITKELKADLDQIREVSEGLEATSSADFISKYIRFTQDLDLALKNVLEYPAKIDTNIERFEVLMTVLAKIGTDNSKALVKKLTDEVLPETKRKLKEVLGEQLVRYSALATKGRALLTGGQPLSLGDGLETSRERPPVRAVELDDIAVGTIDLNDTPADRGDELTVKAELFTTDETGEEDVQQWTSKTFRVDRFGITASFTSHLVLVNRLGSGLATDPDTDFDPAPSASWTLRKRVRPPEDKEDSFTELYRFLDPGLGINTAAMDFEDENFQLGVGGHLSLFNDLLIFGYGYNLQAERDHDYFYLGIGVLEALETVGSVFGGASGSPKRHGGPK
ncbi:MAG: hypothetical protein JSU94_05795 [Phycisphaerales bacterium]|nr:MAG: hypothetical protein JSU94_05795 [Phycisphaerales bacterium]